MPNFNKIVEDLKNRKVFKSATIYLATAYVFLQAAQLIIPALLIPEWTFRLLVALVILGFPLTLILSWVYDITPSSGVGKPEDHAEDVKVVPRDVSSDETTSKPLIKVAPSTKNIILVSTLMGIIFYTNILPLLQDLVNTDRSFKTAILTPEQRLYTKYEHPEEVAENIRLIENYLSNRDEENNLEALTLADELIIGDSTQADYYAYRGWAYFQRYDQNKEKPVQILLESEKDFKKAVYLQNLTQDPAVISYYHLASIYLIQGNVDDAYAMIKKAMRIDKKYPDVKKKLKEINKRKIQVLERSS